MRVLVTVVTYNEGTKLRNLITQFPEDRNYDILVVDDGSTDNTAAVLAGTGFAHITHHTNLGVGAAIRDAVAHAGQQGYEAVVIMAGNGKMQPAEIPRLIKPLIADRADYVQGSRYLEGGRSPNLPLFRRIMIRAYTGLVNLAMRARGTDITCGFRAYTLKALEHPHIDIGQSWLDRYELEYYIHYWMLRLKRRVVEVPVSMVYPETGSYSKIKPLTGWWSMVRPWLLLLTGLRK